MSLTKLRTLELSNILPVNIKILSEGGKQTITAVDARDYGLFLADEDTKKGVWLESGRSLDYYILRNGDLLEYKKKLRILRVRMLDGMLKTVLVDDSQLVANLMVVICTKIGITNHDEYSLVREFVEEQSENIKSGNFSTLTLKKKKEEKGDRDVKMDQLRKKLKTDDEVNWIDPSKTLREQGIDEVETVLLRRKFFFSDQNVDSRDPVQLSLLYVQARDAILDGTHPVTQSQACFFSGIQCQVQFGDYNEEKHKPGFLDLREFLPQSYFKVKGIERKVFVEYKKHNGLSEVDAKVLYTKTARSLNTYGVTFFLVKEKMKGKNKLVPRLLGVTKDSVLRLDEKTKEILKTWPLTTVRRWGASPNTFTLDFGDYSDQYYSVQTTEAEQILQIISGYIDIILRKQKAKDHFGIEGNEGSTMVEDSISPLKATIMQHETSPMGKGTVESVSVAIPAIIRSGVDGEKLYGTGYLDSAQYTTVCGQVNIAHAPSVMQQTKFLTVTSEPQIALVSTLATAKEIIKNAETHLSCTSTIPDTNNDLASLRWREETVDIHKQNIGSQIAAMNAATAQMLTSTTGQQDTVDYAAVESAITTITTNLPELTKGVRMIATLIKDNSSGDKLLNAARKLCWAFSDLLRATETRSKAARHSLLNAASHIGEASHEVLFNIGEEGVLKKETQDVLLSLAKTVANTTAVLVLKARNIAAICENSVTQNHVISAATYCALATSQLVACAKVVAPTLNTQACQNQLIYAVKEVTKAVQNLVEVCGMASTEINVYEDLSLAASNVTKTLNNFLNHITLVTQDKLSEETTQEQAIEKIFFATDKLFSISGDAAEMVRQARIVGQATARLIQSIKGDADKRSNTEQQKKLLAAAKVLADATAKMVEAARQCASSPQDNQVQNYLRLAVKELREATATAATPAIRRSLMLKLERYAKVAASSATEYIAALARVDPYIANRITQKQLNEKCKCITELISELISGVKGASSEPDDSMMQLNLINASEKFCHSAESMIKVVKVVVPTISDYSLSLELDNNSQQLGTVLTDLRSASCHAREVCTGLQLDAAETSVNKLISELQDLSNSIILTIKPLPEENEESSLLKLITICQKLRFCTSQIVTAVRQQSDYYTGNAAAEYAAALKDLHSAIKGVLYTIENQDTKQTILTISINILCMSVQLIQEARTALHNENYLSDVDALAAIEKKIFCHLDEYISSLPWQKSIDDTIHQIKEASHVLETDCRSEIQNFCELQNNLAAAADDLNNASSYVLSSIRFPIQLSTTLERFMSTFCSLIGTGVNLAGQTTNDTRSRIIASLKTVSTNAINLLSTIKSIAVEPIVPNRRNQLSLVGRSLTDAINCLINDCISETPGQIECDNSVRSIQSMIPLLENSCEPISDCSYFKCLNIVMEKSKSLGDGMTGIANHAKKSEHDLFSKAIKEVSYSICGLIEAAAQASYLAGVSDPLSLSAKSGLIDQKHFSRAVESIHSSCNVICNPAVSQQQILAAATSIAKHTSALCNACRLASSKTNNPIAKRHFVQSAKDVANSTASLVREIKVLDANFSDINQVECIKATKPLLEAVDNLLTYASYSEFSSQPDKISTAAVSTQEPIIEAGKSIISSSCAMILTAKSLSVKCKDPPTWQLLANHSKSVSDSIKALVSSMREKAPGQKECDLAITKLTQKLQDLDTVSLKILSQTLVSQNKNSFQGFIDQMNKIIYELRERIKFLQNVAKYEAENVGQVVLQIISFFDPLIDSGIEMISHLMKSKQQIFLLDQTKTVLECTLQLIFVTKECGGNPKATNLHAELDESVYSTKESLQELQSTFENISISNGTVTGLTDLIFRAIRQLQENVLTSQDSFDSFVTYQARIIEAAKDISRMALEILSISRMENTKLNSLVIKMSHKYTDLAQDTLRATIATFNEEMSTKLRIAVQELGNACLYLVQDACTCPIMSSDLEVYEKSSDYSKIIGEKVSLILAILQAGSRGTQACINAASTVSGIIGDLDTTIMFATAGTLHAENENETFADHRENILKTAKALVEDTKTLVAGAASSQEQLAVAAQNAVSTIVELAEVVKYGAASLGSENLEAQVMLINAIRDVTFALGDLIQATKAASGKLVNDPTMAQLKDSAKINIPNFQIIRKDRQVGQHGGLAILIEQNIKYKAKTAIFNIDHKIETLAISIPIINNNRSSQDQLLIVSLYHVPNTIISSNEWNNLLDASKNYQFSLIAGDFNAHYPLGISTNLVPQKIICTTPYITTI
ncbi:talin-2 [Copidosoma floridanum]|uniref:talin-2 n=1 Tax=Copidosoma floridanum TaxID=29053 RepID=UPI000C6F63FD|nr:talin-2 [Copidosoma floridanum]